jgi:prepilin-type N-terminal cleavage/methylation domain-containing protein
MRMHRSFFSHFSKNSDTKFQRGFTLIELLVVIAIISILSAVILVSLKVAKEKGNTSSIYASLTSMRNEAELILTKEGDYGAVCGLANKTQNAKIAEIIASVNKLSGGSPSTCSDGTIAPNDTSYKAKTWAFATYLNRNSATIVCVDSTNRISTKDKTGNAYTQLTGILSRRETSLNLAQAVTAPPVTGGTSFGSGAAINSQQLCN